MEKQIAAVHSGAQVLGPRLQDATGAGETPSTLAHLSSGASSKKAAAAGGAVAGRDQAPSLALELSTRSPEPCKF
jgi:hypothetical protein